MYCTHSFFQRITSEYSVKVQGLGSKPKGVDLMFRLDSLLKQILRVNRSNVKEKRRDTSPVEFLQIGTSKSQDNCTWVFHIKSIVALLLEKVTAVETSLRKVHSLHQQMLESSNNDDGNEDKSLYSVRTLTCVSTCHKPQERVSYYLQLKLKQVRKYIWTQVV